jgi:hypothetical protein
LVRRGGLRVGAAGKEGRAEQQDSDFRDGFHRYL